MNEFYEVRDDECYAGHRCRNYNIGNLSDICFNTNEKIKKSKYIYSR